MYKAIGIFMIIVCSIGLLIGIYSHNNQMAAVQAMLLYANLYVYFAFINKS